MKFTYVLFALTMLLQPLSQIFEKLGIMQVGGINSIQDLFRPHTLFRMATNPYVVTGVGLSGVCAIFWLGLLSQWDVSYLYPMGSIAQIVLAVYAFLLLGESFTMLKCLGIVVIIVGTILLNWRGP